MPKRKILLLNSYIIIVKAKIVINRQVVGVSISNQINFKVVCVMVMAGLLFLTKPSFSQEKYKNLQTSSDYIKAVKHYRYLNPDSALFFVKKGIANANTNQDEIGLAALLNQYGMIEDNAAKYKQAREKYIQAEAIYRKNKNDNGLASTLVRLGVVEKRKGNYDKALANYYEALKLSEKSKSNLGILEARIVLSQVYFELGDYKSTIENLVVAEKIDEKIPVSNFSFNMYTSFGDLYIKLKEYDKAIFYIEKGLSKLHSVEYNGSKIGLLKLLGMAYHKKGNKEKAVASLKSAVKLSKEIKNVMREQITLTELAEVYIKDVPDTALIYLNEALSIAKRHKLHLQEITILNSMSTLFKQKGDYKTALSYQEESYKISNEIFYKDMAQEVFNLETAYELNKSNLEVSELKLKNSKAKMVKNVMISVAIATTLLLIITLIFYYRAKHLNKLLKNANHNLEESNDQKDKFFSIVAHDIRSPLVSTVSIMKLIGSGDLEEDMQHEMINKLSNHCETSLEILDKLLKWGQMQMKGVRINVTEFNPLLNFTTNIGLLKETAERKNINIALDVPSNLLLKADSNHLDFVIRNLLANAIKFTPIGGYVKLSAVDKRDGNINFKVEDSGVGISEARLAKIFELSATGTKGTSSEEGTSLGLVICKQFIEANNGVLTIKSVVNVGTTFEFTLAGSTKNEEN